MEIFSLKRRVVLDDFLRAEPLCQGIENDSNVNACAADKGPPRANLWVNSDPCEQSFISHVILINDGTTGAMPFLQ